MTDDDTPDEDERSWFGRRFYTRETRTRTIGGDPDVEYELRTARVAAIALAAFVVLAIVGIYFLAGVSHERADSQYTGVVVDVEQDSGLIFETTEVHVRTSERSSQTETFCVRPGNEADQIPTLRQALQDQNRVTVTYSRDHYVPRSDCLGGLSVVQNIEVHND